MGKELVPRYSMRNLQPRKDRAAAIIGPILMGKRDRTIAGFYDRAGATPRLHTKHILEGVDASLKRLQMEYVDLVFCHRPELYTPMEETVWAMNHVINQGKAFYWGTSEWSATQIMEAYGIARREHLIPPLMEQPEYHMFTS